MQQCNKCGGKGWCLETRTRQQGTRRRYECQVCKVRWNTIEVPATRNSSQGVLLATERIKTLRQLDEAAEAISVARALLSGEAPNVRGETER